MSYIAHQYFIWTMWSLSIRIFLFIAQRRSQKTKINFVIFVRGVKPTSWCFLVVIVLLFDREIFGPKILMMETTIYFLSEGLAVWRLSRNQFKPVWAETVKNYPARKLELLSPRNRYICHQCGIWKIMGKAIFFVFEKRRFLFSSNGL